MNYKESPFTEQMRLEQEERDRNASRAYLRPGSRDAIEAGCTCPVMDNSYGRGYLNGAKDPKTGRTIFVYAEGCPLHGGRE